MGELRDTVVMGPFEFDLECRDGSFPVIVKNAVLLKGAVLDVTEEHMGQVRSNISRIVCGRGEFSGLESIQEFLREKGKIPFSNGLVWKADEILLIKKKGG